MARPSGQYKMISWLSELVGKTDVFERFVTILKEAMLEPIERYCSKSCSLNIITENLFQVPPVSGPRKLTFSKIIYTVPLLQMPSLPELRELSFAEKVKLCIGHGYEITDTCPRFASEQTEQPLIQNITCSEQRHEPLVSYFICLKYVHFLYDVHKSLVNLFTGPKLAAAITHSNLSAYPRGEPYLSGEL